MHDAEAALAAAVSLAELAVEPRVRARYLVDAAEVLLGTDADPRLGPDRRAPHAGQRRCSSARCRPTPTRSRRPGRLATVLLEERQGERLVSAFREAIATARSPDAIVMLGSEIARVARDDLRDLTVAIDAMRRVRAVAPQHVPSLLTLAELCIAQRAWPEAVDALEAVVSTSREVGPKLTAFFALASIYEKVLFRPDDVDRVLRAALELDPSNVRALRALLRRIAAEPAPADEATQRARREEMADWLGRLADVERDPEQKTAILLELSEVHVRLANARAAERTLVEAVVTSPSNARAFARLTALFRRADGMDQVGYARVARRGHRLRRQAGAGRRALVRGARPARGPRALAPARRRRPPAAGGALDPTLLRDTLRARERVRRRWARTTRPPALLIGDARAHRRSRCSSIADPAAGLALLEQAFSPRATRRRGGRRRASCGRSPVSSTTAGARGCAPGGRRPSSTAAGALDRAALVTHVLPPEGRHILLEVAAAIAGVEAKMLRGDLSEVGISLARPHHFPQRPPDARRARPPRATAEGLGEVELAIAPIGDCARACSRRTCRGSSWRPSLVEQPETAQLASLARAAARIAYGVPWLEELPPRTSRRCSSRQRARWSGLRHGGVDVITSKLVAQHEATIARALSGASRKAARGARARTSPRRSRAACRPTSSSALSSAPSCAPRSS